MKDLTTLYALEDKEEGHTIPNAGNMLAPTQKAVYGTQEDADRICRLANDKNPGRFEVVPVVFFQRSFVDKMVDNIS